MKGLCAIPGRRCSCWPAESTWRYRPAPGPVRSASWARIASTGSTATTRAPVRASRAELYRCRRRGPLATVCGRRPRASRSQSESASGGTRAGPGRNASLGAETLLCGAVYGRHEGPPGRQESPSIAQRFSSEFQTNGSKPWQRGLSAAIGQLRGPLGEEAIVDPGRPTRRPG